MKKLTFKIIGMHCSSCSLLIDSALEELPGVKSSQTSYTHQTATVEFDEKHISKNKILEIIKKEGYDVES